MLETDMRINNMAAGALAPKVATPSTAIVMAV